jgi:hypothetical protein
MLYEGKNPGQRLAALCLVQHFQQLATWPWQVIWFSWALCSESIKMHRDQQKTKNPWIVILFWGTEEIEPSALCMLGKCSIPWAMPPALWIMNFARWIHRNKIVICGDSNKKQEAGNALLKLELSSDKQLWLGLVLEAWVGWLAATPWGLLNLTTQQGDWSLLPWWLFAWSKALQSSLTSLEGRFASFPGGLCSTDSRV